MKIRVWDLLRAWAANRETHPQGYRKAARGEGEGYKVGLG